MDFYTMLQQMLAGPTLSMARSAPRMLTTPTAQIARAMPATGPSAMAQKKPIEFFDDTAAPPAAMPAAGGAPSIRGLVEPGTIKNLYDRKVLKNPDGSVSTTSSMSIGIDNGREVLIPTVVDGVRLSPNDAIAHYRRTGEHLGIFDSPENADVYAESLHNDQARRMGLGAPESASTQSGPALGGMVEASALMPWLQAQASRPARNTRRVSNDLGRRPAQAAQPQEPAQNPLALISQASAAEPAVAAEPDFASQAVDAAQQAVAQGGVEPAVAMNADPQASSGIMQKLNEYIGGLGKKSDPKDAMMDNLLALAMGGLNTAAAASRPGATPFGSFAEGNAGGLNTMIALRNARRADDIGNERTALSAMGTVANLENAAATRADTAAYRKELAADRDANRMLQAKQLGISVEQFDRQMRDRETTRQAELDLQKQRLALEKQRTGAEVAKDAAYTKNLESGAGPSGATPAVVATHKYIMNSGIETDPQKAWQMASRDYNDEKIASTIYTKMLDDPTFSSLPPKERQRVAQDHLATIRGLQSGEGAEGPGANYYTGSQPPPMKDARQDSKGVWWAPDKNAKSGWAPVITKQ